MRRVRPIDSDFREAQLTGRAQHKGCRPLTPGERALASSIFGAAIDYDPVRVHRRKWFFLQPRNTLMAPTGHIHIHPLSDYWSEDFSRESLHRQALFLHELTHVWQTQRSGRYYLPLMRHPFCRYAYRFDPDRPFRRYGIEQQAEIIRHAFLTRNGMAVAGKPPFEYYRQLLPFLPGR